MIQKCIIQFIIPFPKTPSLENHAHYEPIYTTIATWQISDTTTTSTESRTRTQCGHPKRHCNKKQ